MMVFDKANKAKNLEADTRTVRLMQESRLPMGVGPPLSLRAANQHSH